MDEGCVSFANVLPPKKERSCQSRPGEREKSEDLPSGIRSL